MTKAAKGLMGVGQFLCVDTQESFILASPTFAGSFANHVQLLTEGIHPLSLFQERWHAYGPHSFEFSILQLSGRKNLLHATF